MWTAAEIAHLVAAHHGAAPPEVRQRARLVLADTVACMSVAAETSFGFFNARVSNGATVIATGRKVDPRTAAFVNAFSAAETGLDETNFHARQHVALHVIPAALAAAEVSGATLADLVDAVISGYEVAARFGAGVRLVPSVHSHGVLGMVGGAVASALLLGANEDGVARAVRLATSLFTATSPTAREAGAEAFNGYFAFAATRALDVAAFAVSGADGDPHALRGVVAEVFAAEPISPNIFDDYGSHFYMQHNFLKMHGCCADISASVDAVRRVFDDHDLTYTEVSRVVVETSLAACDFPDPTNVNNLSRRFCLPYAVAAREVLGHCGTEAFSSASIADPRIALFASKIEAVVSSEATQSVPDCLIARVQVYTMAGEVFSDVYSQSPDSREHPQELVSWRGKVDRLLQQAQTTLPSRVVDQLRTAPEGLLISDIL